MATTQEQKAARVISFAKKRNLSEADLLVVYQTLQRTWSVIGSDVLGPEGSQSIPRAEVIEVCLDADYAESYGVTGNGEKVAWAKFRALDYDDQIKIAQGAFKFTRYGW